MGHFNLHPAFPPLNWPIICRHCLLIAIIIDDSLQRLMFDIRRRYWADLIYKLSQFWLFLSKNESDTIQFVILKICISKWIVMTLLYWQHNIKKTPRKQKSSAHQAKWINNNTIEYYDRMMLHCTVNFPWFIGLSWKRRKYCIIYKTAHFNFPLYSKFCFHPKFLFCFYSKCCFESAWFSIT